MIGIGVDDRLFKKRIRSFASELTAAGATDAVITPTTVLGYLSEAKGKSVLKSATRAAVNKVRNESAPKVKQAIKGKREGWEQRAAKQWRRWAYRFIEELYVSIRDNRTLGNVSNERTMKQKSRPPSKGGAAKKNRGAWGVRHARPDWRQLQKGKRASGKWSQGRHAPEPTGDLIVVYVSGTRVRGGGRGT
jgi:hypothetical protein